MVLQETYELWDTIYHNESELTTNTTFNKILDSTSFAVEFDALATQNNSQVWFRIGNDTSNCNRVGLIYQQLQGIAIRSGGSDILTSYVSSRIPLNTVTHIKFTYDNGVMTYTDDDETITVTNTTVPPSKFLSVVIVNGATLSNVKLYYL